MQDDIDQKDANSPDAQTQPAKGPWNRRRRRRKGQRPGEEAAMSPPGPASDSDQVTAEENANPASSEIPRRRSRRRKPVASRIAKSMPHYEVPEDHRPFAHPSEAEIGRILDFYGLKWLYEPRSFPLKWDGERVTEMFTPDFYLPELDLYLEMTTLKQSLVTAKNRKLRHIRELYPDINIKLLYRRDIHRLLAKYGFGPLAQGSIPDVDRVLISKPRLGRRVAELGTTISQDYAGLDPVLIGVLRGVFCFMADLMRQISLPLSVDFMSVSYYGGAGSENGVRITKGPDIDVKGRHVILVEDIVDTGMTLNYLLRYLRGLEPASLKVCALLDKRVRRITDVPIDYVGFDIPDEFIVGYGLDQYERYRNLPFIGVLKPGE